MKTTKYLLMGLAALAMTACNKNDEPVATQGEATVSVRVSGSQLRAANKQGETGENNIKKLNVLIFNGEYLDAKGESDNSDQVLKIHCTAGRRTIVALANVPADVNLNGVTLSSLKTITTALKAKFESENSSNLFMSTELKEVTVAEGDNCLGYANASADKVGYNDLGAEFTLKRVNARVDLDKTTVELATAYKNEGFEVHPTQLGIIMATAKSKIFDPVKVETNYLYGTGLPNDGTGLATGLTTTNYEESADLIMDYGTAEMENPQRFYLFANENAEHPTILVIAAKLRNTGNTDLTGDQLQKAIDAGWVAGDAKVNNAITYFPIRINHEGTGYTLVNNGRKEVIERNHIYELTGLKITRPGVKDPHTDIKSAVLDVKCTVANWDLVTQEVVW